LIDIPKSYSSEFYLAVFSKIYYGNRPMMKGIKPLDYGIMNTRKKIAK
jgi:hypothetical protein